MSLPTDCPQRNERRGWMGDAGLSIDETLFNFDYIKFLSKFFNNDNWIINHQMVQLVIQYHMLLDLNPADPNWGTAYPSITWYLYEHTGDLTIIEKYYQGIQGWVDCLTVQYQQTGLANFYYHYWDDREPVNQTSNQSLVIVLSISS